MFENVSDYRGLVLLNAASASASVGYQTWVYGPTATGYVQGPMGSATVKLLMQLTSAVTSIPVYTTANQIFRASSNGTFQINLVPNTGIRAYASGGTATTSITVGLLANSVEGV